MKQFLIAILIFFQADSFAQPGAVPDRFDFKVMEVEGDLNKDNLPDKVVITQDTSNENAPYRLQVFLKDPDGQLQLIVSSTRIIAPQYPDGRNEYSTANAFLDVTIEKDVLSVNFELMRGHYEHRFRYQNGNVELVGFSMVYSDGFGVMTITDFNLSTGNRIEKTERYDTGKLLSVSKKKILIRPLPKLQDVVPMENDLY
jgi:hypothetical protein